MSATMQSSQRPLELILARNLITSISTPAFLLDDHARLVFYNEAAGGLLGMPFEDAGRMSADEWTATFGPFDDEGEPIPLDDLGTTEAIQDGRPAHARFRIRAIGGERAVEASAVPIVASEQGASGAMIFFWPRGGEEG
jgi:PAS domain-containing protein